MKINSSCGCGIVIGVLLALALCAGVWYFFYCRRNPDSAGEHFGEVEKRWEHVKQGGDKGLHYVKKSFTGKDHDPMPGDPDVPETAPLLPPHPEERGKMEQFKKR